MSIIAEKIQTLSTLENILWGDEIISAATIVVRHHQTFYGTPQNGS
jgi:hypothetical protein